MKLGGGKNPYLSLEQKKTLAVKIVGVDIDAAELNAAPVGVYDKTICTDIAVYRGQEDADLIICNALLEHVKNVPEAFKALHSTLKPGGKALIFVPSRNAVFARLNLLLPEKMKRKILFTIFPQAKRDQGFPSFYHKCTPKEFRALAEENNLNILEEKHYYKSSYFTFFAPLHIVWRIWLFLFKALKGSQAAETFIFVLQKPK